MQESKRIFASRRSLQYGGGRKLESGRLRATAAFIDRRQANAKYAGLCNGATFMIDTGE